MTDAAATGGGKARRSERLTSIISASAAPTCWKVPIRLRRSRPQVAPDASRKRPRDDDGPAVVPSSWFRRVEVFALPTAALDAAAVQCGVEGEQGDVTAFEMEVEVGSSRVPGTRDAEVDAVTAVRVASCDVAVRLRPSPKGVDGGPSLLITLPACTTRTELLVVCTVELPDLPNWDAALLKPSCTKLHTAAAAVRSSPKIAARAQDEDDCPALEPATVTFVSTSTTHVFVMGTDFDS